MDSAAERGPTGAGVAGAGIAGAGVVGAEVVVACRDLDATLGFFTGRLGFRVDAIFPADHPEVAVVSAHGVTLRLDSRAQGESGVLRLRCAEPWALAGGERRLTAPNGTVVELVDADPPPLVPPVRQSLVVTRLDDDPRWGVGRAGMRYRDLIPDRQGGRFIASHILIPHAGPVPDYVHFHKVRFQMIFCRTGWVRVVYEDQGEPFVLHAGDCVLQPPEIRHRVLESSGALEVIEIGCPAEHETRVDHGLALPTGAVRSDRDFGGQRFVRHVAADTPWAPWMTGWESRDTGIGTATQGLAGARVLRPAGASPVVEYRFEVEFHFLFVLGGTVTLRLDGRDTPLAAADSVVIPSHTPVEFAEPSSNLEILEVTLPGNPQIVPNGPDLMGGADR